MDCVPLYTGIFGGFFTISAFLRDETEKGRNCRRSLGFYVDMLSKMCKITCVSTLPELEQHIHTGWEQLQAAVAGQDWGATQSAYRNMSKLQDLHEQSRNLQSQIAALSEAEPIASGYTSVDRQPAPSPSAFTVRRATKRPRELRIGAFRAPVALNNQVLIETANWLIGQGRALPAIPNFVQRSRAGFAESAQVKPLQEGYFIEIGDSQEALFQKARKLLNLCGLSGVKIEILLEDNTTRVV